MHLEKIYLLLIVLLTGSIYGVLWSNLLFFLSVVLLVMIIVNNSSIRYSKNLITNFVFYSVFLGAVFILHYLLVPLSNDFIPYLNIYLRFLSISFFIFFVETKKVDNISLLNGVLIIIALHAVLSFCLSFFVNGFLSPINTEAIYSNSFFYLFFFNSSFDLFGITLYRNQGVFWEPGILQIYMNILFFINTFIYKNRKNQILAVFIILSTYSTTGIALLFIQLFILLFSYKMTTINRISIIGILAAVMFPIFILNYTNKIQEQSDVTDVTSSSLRLYDLLEGIHIIKEYPLTGIGLSADTYLNVKNANNSLFGNYSMEFINSILDRKSSNSVMYFLTRFGLPFSLLWFFILYRQKIIPEKRMLFFLIVIVSNLSEPLLFYPFFLLFIASGLFGLKQIVLNKKPQIEL